MEPIFKKRFCDVCIDMGKSLRSLSKSAFIKFSCNRDLKVNLRIKWFVIVFFIVLHIRGGG